MPKLIYSCAFYLLIPFVLARLFWRSIREPGYRQDISQRFGYFHSRYPGKVIWIHAVSAGETIAVVPLVRRLVERGYPCIVTNMTATGRERATTLLGDSVEHCYAPYDLPGGIRRFIRNNQPRMLMTVDTELWPNMLHGCAAAEIPTMVVNGRLSHRSARGYQRISGLAVPMLGKIDALAVQTEQHRQRFVSLGVDDQKITVTGSIKFDAGSLADKSKAEAAARLTGGRTLLLGASTHEGEESALLRVLERLVEAVPDLLLVLAPRHTQRVDEVSRACDSSGHPAAKFSEGRGFGADTKVLVIDVMGELDAYFSLARVAFIGGSLVPVGGHNLLEAVRENTAVVMGPHLDNIEDIAAQFSEENGMAIVENETALEPVLSSLLTDRGKRERMVLAAANVLERNRGALNRVEGMALELLGDH